MSKERREIQAVDLVDMVTLVLQVLRGLLDLLDLRSRSTEPEDMMIIPGIIQLKERKEIKDHQGLLTFQDLDQMLTFTL